MPTPVEILQEAYEDARNNFRLQGIDPDSRVFSRVFVSPQLFQLIQRDFAGNMRFTNAQPPQRVIFLGAQVNPSSVLNGEEVVFDWNRQPMTQPPPSRAPVAYDGPVSNVEFDL